MLDACLLRELSSSSSSPTWAVCGAWRYSHVEPCFLSWKFHLKRPRNLADTGLLGLVWCTPTTTYERFCVCLTLTSKRQGAQRDLILWADTVPSGCSERMPSLRGNPCPYAGRSEVRSARLGRSVTFLICFSHHLHSFFSRLRNLSREEFFVSFLASLQKAGLFVIGVFCAVFKSCQTREGVASIYFWYQRQL